MDKWLFLDVRVIIILRGQILHETQQIDYIIEFTKTNKLKTLTFFVTGISRKTSTYLLESSMNIQKRVFLDVRRNCVYLQEWIQFRSFDTTSIKPIWMNKERRGLRVPCWWDCFVGWYQFWFQDHSNLSWFVPQLVSTLCSLPSFDPFPFVTPKSIEHIILD